jgi:hypothetical protein
VRHALANDLGAPRVQEELQTLDVSATGKLLALAIHPENAEGERGVDRGLGLLDVDADWPMRSRPRV